jgi:hypothetical protein
VQRLDWAALAIAIALAWVAAGSGDAWFAPIERLLGALARRKRLAVIAVGAAVILIRVALLPWMPAPEPRVHDEFSYLLAADTFLHGRLANPPHPLWTYFDTFHVLQHPTYASMYPPAQGAALAAGKLLGSPWIGVLLSSSAMCMAITWMLQGWAPAEWALLGGGLALCRLAIFSYWTNSYWGGSVAAIGAALVLGALPRMLRLASPRPRDAVICGVGAGILANSRPLEGFVFCLPVAVAILWWCLQGGIGERSARARRVLLPLAGVLAIAVGFAGYYNARVGGSATTFPEMIETRALLTSPIFVWQGDKPRLTYANPQFDDFYNNDVPDLYRPGWRSALDLTEWKSGYAWRFFLGPALTVALLALPWVLLRDRLARLLLAQFVLCALGIFSVAFFHPHYAAPMMTTLMVLVTLGFQQMSHWRLLGRAFGVGVVRVAAVYCVLIGPVDFVKFAISQSPRMSVRWSAVRLHLPHYWVFVVAAGVLAAFLVLAERRERSSAGAFRLPLCAGGLAVLLVILGGQARHDDYPFDTGQRDEPFRRPIEQQLDAMPGEHLVLVRYGDCHDAGEEYVYNDADIDHARIVWAREVPGQSLVPLLNYFRNRDVWVFQPDDGRKLDRYSASADTP